MISKDTTSSLRTLLLCDGFSKDSTTWFRFSVSKWVHLNDGDDGIKSFFHRVYEVLRQGGRFVLEPQPWDSYAKARRMDVVRNISRNSASRYAHAILRD